MMSNSSKFKIRLNPAMPAAKAVIAIYLQLLQAIKANEQGSLEAIDSEFLHSFRVAIRRTRSGLSQLKGILPNKINTRYSDYFAWLGKITTPSRDLDVYLLNLADYKSLIPADLRQHLTPLQQFLEFKQSLAQKTLVNHLTSTEYSSPLNEWEQYLHQAAAKLAGKKKSKLSIKQLADFRIYKVYQRVIKQGSTITDDSAASELHDLRKTCKKLRYLTEFFQSLYPATEMKTLLNALRGLQECLGDFQDLAVQEQALKQFSDELMANAVANETFLAIEALLAVLAAKRRQARNEFEGNFAIFSHPDNQILVNVLFSEAGW